MRIALIVPAADADRPASRREPRAAPNGDRLSAGRESRFALLQRRLRSTPTLEQLGRGERAATVVSICSIDLGDRFLASNDLASLETRWLYLVLLAARRDTRVVLVTSDHVPAWELDYWLALAGNPDDVARRFGLIALEDLRPLPLATKLLAQPAALRRIREFTAGPEPAFIASFSVGERERDLALALNLPIHGVDHRFARYATKSGARALFADERVPHPRGRGDLRSTDELVDAIVALRGNPDAPHRVVAKLDRGTTGSGNELMDVDGLPADEDAARAILHRRITALPDDFLSALPDGAIVEELIEAGETASPSAQVRISGTGEITILATHDQLLGGPHGQTYLGCRFPADPQYASQVAALARQIGVRLAREGAIGRFGVDFVAARQPGGAWLLYAVEINLREGGTTHPHGALALLTDGTYDPHTATFTTAGGHIRAARATDSLRHPSYQTIPGSRLLEAAASAGIAWNRERETGVVFTMLRSLPREGRLGILAVGRDQPHCDELFDVLKTLLAKLTHSPTPYADAAPPATSGRSQ